jgi:hypothetical protein
MLSEERGAGAFLLFDDDQRARPSVFPGRFDDLRRASFGCDVLGDAILLIEICGLSRNGLFSKKRTGKRERGVGRSLMTAGTRSLDYARQFGAGHIAVLHEFIQTKLLFILVVVALNPGRPTPDE